MLRFVTALLMSLGLATAAVAAEEHARFAVDTHYKILDVPGNVSDPSKVEVREFFSYACPHCYSLEPAVDKWLESKPEFIDYVRTPVLFLTGIGPLGGTIAEAFAAADGVPSRLAVIGRRICADPDPGEAARRSVDEVMQFS